MEYDFSKSRDAYRIIRYYPEILNAHNMMDSRFFPAYAKKETERMLKCEHLSYVFEVKTLNYMLNDEEGKRVAQKDFNKHYPLTIYENKLILDEYLSFLEANHIKPIMVIMPVHSLYKKYVPQEKRNMFYKVLNEILLRHNVQVLDYFDSYQCPDSHYSDVSHLNQTGAEAFTEKLIRDIEW